jgi:hypothetical protein
MDNTRIPKKCNEWEIPLKKTCVKTTSEMGGLYGEGLLVSTECKRIEETLRGAGCLEVNY